MVEAAPGATVPTFAVVARPRALLRRVFLVCLTCEAVLVLLDRFVARTGLLSYPPVRQLFDMTRESTLGNFFSSVQALGVAAVLWLIHTRVRRDGQTARWRARGWAALSLFFLYLGVDDGAMIHERVGSYASHLAGSTSWFHKTETAFASYSWQLVLGPFFAAAGLLMLLFLWRELRSNGRYLVALAIACYAVAVGLDYLEGRPGSYVALVSSLRMNVDSIQHYAKVLEELTEMVGTTLFLVGFLSHLLSIVPRLEVEVREDSKPT